MRKDNLMQPESVRNYLCVIVLLGLLVLAGLLLRTQPASSQPVPALQATPTIVNGIAGEDSAFVADPMSVASSTVTIEASDPNASETGPDPGVFTVGRTAPFLSALTVNYAVGGTATNGADYTALSGSVTFGAGSPIATIIVTPVDDAIPEGAETVIVTLVNGPGYAVGSPSSATVTIADNDVATPTPTPTPTPAPQIRVSDNYIGNPWLYLWDQPSGRLFEGPNTIGSRIVFFAMDGSRGRIHRGANATGEIMFTVDFTSGRIWAGPNPTGPLLYTLQLVPSSRGPEVRVHEGNEKGPIIYTIHGDNMYDGPNVIGPLVYHGSAPFRGPIQFLLPLLADHRIP